MAYEFIRNFFTGVSFANKIPLLPTVKAEDEELVDPIDAIKEKCHGSKEAQAQWAKYQECNDRVNSRKKTEEICMEELIDYLHVLDPCIAPKLFAKLK